MELEYFWTPLILYMMTYLIHYFYSSKTSSKHQKQMMGVGFYTPKTYKKAHKNIDMTKLDIAVPKKLLYSYFEYGTTALKLLEESLF